MQTAAKKKPTRKSNLTVTQLMATPKHMRAWLRSKTPTAVVTRNLCDSTGCLGANFLKAKGHFVTFGVDRFDGGRRAVPAWFKATFFQGSLPASGPVTAKKALAAIKAAVAEQSS